MQDKTPVNNFETASWETAARGGLLSGYAPERSSKIIGFYNNIYRARANLSDLQNYTFGEGATRSNRQEMMTAYRGVLGLATDEILKAAQQPVATERAAVPVPPPRPGRQRLPALSRRSSHRHRDGEARHRFACS